MKKLLFVFVLFITTLFSNENRAFINIISNAEDTTIFLDGENIGKTPIKQYEVPPNKLIQLKAVVDKKYYTKDIDTEIKVNIHTIPTFDLKFTKATTQLFLVGDDAELYIDDTFIKELNDSNRVITVDADQKTNFKLVDGDARTNINQDVKADSIQTVNYKLKKIHKDVRVYTETINNLMWEDTKEAANTDINWIKAVAYCSDFEKGSYNDFRLPTIEELEELYEYKDLIYNGFGGVIYWSSTTSKDDMNLWEYSHVKNFEDGTTRTAVKEFEKGRVRCVRDITEYEKQMIREENEYK